MNKCFIKTGVVLALTCSAIYAAETTPTVTPKVPAAEFKKTAVEPTKEAPKASISLSEKDKQELVVLANDYAKTMETYFNTEDGKKEFNVRNELRDAFLGLNENTDVSLEKVKEMGEEISGKIKEWDQKIKAGMLAKKDQKVTMEHFLTKAKAYSELYKKVSTSPVYKDYFTKYSAFKTKVQSQLKAGIKGEDIVKALRDGGVTNERVLSRPTYWEKKDGSSES